MNCRVLCGDSVLFDGAAKIVVARSPQGEFAVMEGHEPMLAALAAGPLRVETEDGRELFALEAGTLRVDSTGVIVVAAGLLDAAPPGDDGAADD